MRKCVIELILIENAGGIKYFSDAQIGHQNKSNWSNLRWRNRQENNTKQNIWIFTSCARHMHNCYICVCQANRHMRLDKLFDQLSFSPQFMQMSELMRLRWLRNRTSFRMQTFRLSSSCIIQITMHWSTFRIGERKIWLTRENVSFAQKGRGFEVIDWDDNAMYLFDITFFEGYTVDGYWLPSLYLYN